MSLLFVFFGILLAHGPRLTRRTTDGRFLLFCPAGLRRNALGFSFLIIIMVANTSDGVQVILFLLRRALGGWDPGIEKRQSRRI